VLELLKLKTFQVVAATSGFRRAAAELGYSQASVTMHIQALERELGAPLFDRGARNVILTDVGRRMLDYANRLLALADEAKAAIRDQGDPTGPLSVGAPEALMAYRLPEVFRQFQILYPHVHLSLASRSDFQVSIDEVLDGKLDLAVIVGETVHSKQLTTRFLGREEILIVKAPDYNFGAAADFHLQDIAKARVLLTGKSCTYRLLFDRTLSAAKVYLDDTLELGSIEAAKRCAMAGMGLAVLPKMAVATELKQKRLVSLPWSGPRFQVHVQMLRHRQRPASPALQALWGLAEHSFEEESARGG